MSKVKYYYDPDTLSYRKLERSKGKSLRMGLLFVLASAFFAALFLLILFSPKGIRTPNELALERENQYLKLQIGLLDRRIEMTEQVAENLQDRDNNLYRIYFEANPIPEQQRKAGFGGVNRYKKLEGYENSDLVIETTKQLDILSKQLVIQSKSLDEIQKLAENREAFLQAIPAVQPINNSDLTRMASGFGWRRDPFTKARKKHYGMDFTAPKGTPVYATGDGVVVRADNRSSGYGKHIRIDHGYGYMTLYAHLSKYNVRRKKRVKRGDLIGYVGSTGRSMAPHLHYEVFKDNRRINPINFYYGSLSPEEYTAMLKAASQENQSLD